MKSKYCKVLGCQKISENNHRISVSMGKATSAIAVSPRKVERGDDDVGELLAERHRDMAVTMFRIEMDTDFRVRRTMETRRSLGKARRCLRDSLSRAERNGSNDEGGRSEGVKATGWSPPTFVVPLVKFCRILRNSVKEIFRSRFNRSNALLFLPAGRAAWKFICLFVVSVALVYCEFMFFARFKAYKTDESFNAKIRYV